MERGPRRSLREAERTVLSATQIFKGFRAPHIRVVVRKKKEEEKGINPDIKGVISHHVHIPMEIGEKEISGYRLCLLGEKEISGYRLRKRLY